MTDSQNDLTRAPYAYRRYRYSMRRLNKLRGLSRKAPASNRWYEAAYKVRRASGLLKFKPKSISLRIQFLKKLRA